ncbi:MAG: ABC transporter ATP-binding protein [Cyclobacteriaceae bacterium]
MSSDSEIVLKVENLSKVYRLGEVGTGTISHDLNRWFAKIRGKEDPFSTVGSVNDRTQQAKKGEYVNALSDINFEVKRGEVLGIIGKNGAGKSTLLKVISQITAPTTGSIKAKGRIASLLEVGTGMHPEMTGKENVYLNGTILGMTRREIDAKFEEIMDFAGCTKYADTPVKRYSSGMKVRLGFAVAAFLEPEILIVDEVLAVGDAEFQKKAIGKMQDISHQGGRTVLFVSHNMGSVSQICDRGMVLENGKPAFEGSQHDAVLYYLQSNEELVKTDLKDRKDRMGTGQLRVTGFKITDLKGLEVAEVPTGKDLKVSLKFEMLSEAVSPNISISIRNSADVPVTLHHSRLINKDFGKITKSGVFEFLIPSIALTPDQYFLSYSIMENNGRGGYIDGLQNFTKITVIEGDYYPAGEAPPPNFGPMLMDAKWEVKYD